MTKRWNGLLVYDKEGSKRNASYIKMHEEAGEKLNMPIHFLYDTDVMEYLETNRESVDFCMVRTICPALTKQIEARGIPCFNSSFVSEICNHKGKTYDYILKNCEIPLVKTKTFQNVELSEKFLKEYPDYVIKAVDGHGGKQVFLTNESFDSIQKEIAGSDFILQPFVKGSGVDLRVYVIGKEIVGAVKRQANNSFRANFSLGGSVTSFHCDKEIIDYVNQVVQVFDFGMVGIDFILDENNHWLLNEIEDEYKFEQKQNKLTLKQIEIMLNDKFSLFEIPMPVQEKDYPFDFNKIPFYTPISMVDDLDYESVEEAQKAMIEDFENNVFSLMKEYIKDILETYKIYQLKKYYTYCENEQNYYFKVNKEIERIINLMVKRFKLDLPEYLKHFNYVPSFTRFSGKQDEQMYHLWQLKHLEETNYVEEIKKEFIDRILAYDAERFFIYVTQYLKKDINLEELTIVDDKTNEEKKVYHFNFDTLAQCFFEELLKSTEFIIKDNPFLQEDVEGVLV